MGRNRGKKKKRSESGDDWNDSKHINIQDTPEGFETISRILSEVNSEEEINIPIGNLVNPLSSFSDQSGKNLENMESNKGNNSSGPTNSDIIALLAKIDLKLNGIDVRLKSLEVLESKIDNFDVELKKLWLHIDKKHKVKCWQIE